jgi:GNAT superfamily N-acetyltransferase
MNDLTSFPVELSGYSAKRLELGDAEVLQPLYEQCTEFALLTDGKPASPTAARDEFDAVPEGKTTQDKYIFGLFDSRNVLLGMIESIRNYPDNKTWWLGLMMLAPEQRGKGLGSEFYKGFEHCVAALGVQHVSLSVVEANEEGLRFWKKMGFEVIHKTSPKQFGDKRHRLYVMSRTVNATNEQRDSGSISDWGEIVSYLDERGRVKEWPSRRNRKYQFLVLKYLASKFDIDMFYTEKEVNSLLNQHHTFGDPALLRRELFEAKLLNRKRDGSAYWLPFEG